MDFYRNGNSQYVLIFYDRANEGIDVVDVTTIGLVQEVLHVSSRNRRPVDTGARVAL